MNNSQAPARGGCPVMHGSRTKLADERTGNEHWWPNQLNLNILHQNHPGLEPPGGAL